MVRTLLLLIVVRPTKLVCSFLTKLCKRVTGVAFVVKSYDNSNILFKVTKEAYVWYFFVV